MIEAGLAGTAVWAAHHRRRAVAALAGMGGTVVVAASAATYLYSTGPGKWGIWAQLLGRVTVRGFHAAREIQSARRLGTGRNLNSAIFPEVSSDLR